MNARAEPFLTPWLTADATPVHEARVLTEGGSLARIDLDGHSIPVLGDGGQIRIVMNNDGSIARVAKTWREIAGVRKIARIKPFDTAHREAEQHLARPEKYRLDGWLWGYREHGDGEEQADLRIVQVFFFAPRSGVVDPEAAPQRIEIAAHLDVSETTIDR